MGKAKTFARGKRNAKVMEDDGGGKPSEYLLMADNVVTPVQNDNVEKDMEMVSEPYELQPLGMDSFTVPSNNPSESHARLGNMEPVSNVGYMNTAPSYPRDCGAMQLPEQVQLVNSHHHQHHGNLATDSSLMPNHPLQQPNEPMGLIANHSLPLQPPAPMFILSKPEVMNNSTPADGSTGSPESSTISTPCSTPDLSGRVPPKHSLVAAASAKSRRKYDRILPVETKESKEKYICPVCKMELFSASALTKHIRSHNSTTATSTNINACTICGKVLSSQSSLDRHMLVHSDDPCQREAGIFCPCVPNMVVFFHDYCLKPINLPPEGIKIKLETEDVALKAPLDVVSRIDGWLEDDVGYLRPDKELPTIDRLEEDLASIHPDITISVRLFSTGERPFKCRFCNMSFTTNGNMHRHSRIHEKEGDIPLSQQGGNNNNTASSGNNVAKQNRSHSNGSHMPSNGQSPHQQNTPIRISLEADSVSQFNVNGMMGISKRPSRSPSNSCPQSPVRAQKRKIDDREPCEIIPNPSEPVELHPNKRQAVEEVEGMKVAREQPSPRGDMQTPAMSRPTNGPVYPCVPVASGQNSQNSEGRKNQRKKTASITIDASDSEDKQIKGQGQSELKGQISTSSSASTSPIAKAAIIPVGFAELCFTEFTIDKFSLIARAFCERNPRRSSSIFFNYTCTDCGRAFPCPSALAVHRNAHTVGSTVNCGECQCWFDNPVQQRVHQLQHVGQKVITYFSTSTKDKNIQEVQEQISKEEFLCSMGLQLAKKELHPKIHNAFPRFDKKVNRNYFTRFNQMNFKEFAHVSRGFIDIKQEPMEDDFADISQILKMTSTGVPMGSRNIPSRPSLLPSPGHHRYSTNALQNNHMLYNITADGKESFICKFCGDKFDNLRNYKGHVRSHLGLAAYKCNLCSYSSADKSTLIRHLRTHNGERPFICIICDFAFTTKANCERHVRKKHGKTGKQEIEDSIGYSDSPAEGTADVDAFASPDTVCKYCGEDFKFFRALKHHLRSHSSCRSKPYICRLCTTGFSTKANCVRHIQKQHLEITQSQLEDCIQVNEMLLQEDRDEAHESEDGGRSACSSPIGSSNNQRLSPFPPPAHMSSPRGRLSSHMSPRAPYTATPPIISGAKREMGDTDQPLDFSMKSARSSPVPAHGNGTLPLTPSSTNEGDEPMDLSTHSRSSSSCESSPAPGALRTRGHGAPFQPSAYSLQLSANVSNVTSSHMSEFLASSGGMVPHGYGTGMLQHSPGGTNSGLVARSSAGLGSPLVTGSACLPLLLPTTPPSLMGIPSTERTADDQRDHLKRQASGLTAIGPGEERLISGPPDYGMLRYKREYQKFYNPIVGRLQCPFCKMLFKHGLKLQVHLRSHTNERPFVCNLCNAGFTIKTNLERHLKTRHGTDFHPDLMSTMSCDAIVAGDHDYYGHQPHSGEKVVAMETNNNILDKPCNASSCYSRSQLANGFESGLSAYKMMMGSEQFTDKVDTRIGMAAGAAIENVAKQRALEIAHKSHLSGGEVSMVHSQEINNNNETTEGLQGKLKDRDYYMSHQSAKTKQLLAAKLLERQANGGLHNMQDLASQIRPTVRVMDNKNANAVDMQENELNKKKRNSYADSPHRLVCPYCPRAFPWISSLNRHILTHTGQKPFKCPQCPVMFSTKSNRERHLVRKHGLNVLDPATRQMMDRPFKCHLCVFSSFSTSGNLVRHYKEKHPETEAPDHIIAAGEAALKEQQENGTVLNESDELIIDEEDSTSRPSSPLPPPSMLQDDRDAAQVKRIIMEHMINNPPPRVNTPYTPPDTPDRGINPERDNYNVDKITECWVCGNSFDSRKSLLRHLKEHNIDLPYKCYLCDASFNTRLVCLQHKKDHHSGDWNVLKDKNHIDNVEHFVKVMNAIVNQNLGTHADTTIEDYQVTGEDLMKYRVSMGDDMKPESDYTQRKVYCSLCPKRFWSLQDLRRHMRSHTGEKPFECDICQKRFTLKHSMVRHRRKHAGADTGAASMSASDEENTPEEFTVNLHAPNMASSAKSELSRDQPAAKIRRLNDGTQAVLFDLRGGIGSLGGLGSDSSDLLQNLLGVEETAIDKMLDSNADSAAKLLGVK